MRVGGMIRVCRRVLQSGLGSRMVLGLPRLLRTGRERFTHDVEIRPWAGLALGTGLFGF